MCVCGCLFVELNTVGRADLIYFWFSIRGWDGIEEDDEEAIIYIYMMNEIEWSLEGTNTFLSLSLIKIHRV